LQIITVRRLRTPIASAKHSSMLVRGFRLSNCAYSAPLFALAVDTNTYKLKDTFSCPACSADLSRILWTEHGILRSTDQRPDSKKRKVRSRRGIAHIEGQTQRYSPTIYDQDKLEQIGRHLSAWVHLMNFHMDDRRARSNRVLVFQRYNKCSRHGLSNC